MWSFLQGNWGFLLEKQKIFPIHHFPIRNRKLYTLIAQICVVFTLFASSATKRLTFAASVERPPTH